MIKYERLCCTVSECHESGLQDSSSMFKFPTKPGVRLKWMENLCMPKDAKLSNRRVCRRHFEPHCFGKSKLFAWAVPTLFVGKTDGLHHGAAKKKKLVRKCCIGDCTTRSPPDRLHCFPTEPQLRTEWMKLCRLKDGLKWPFICSRHFRPSLLPNKNSKLPKQALPELNLGTDTEDPLDLPLRNEAEDEGIDEDNSKGTDGAESCPSCQGTKDISVSLQQKLAAALLRIQELEQRLEDHADTEEEEEEEYIFMLMK
ncbi:uncharacterized protein LOC108156590 [Drosophila miranda]|uniref:uncharacterized protein LOC108156590 n=1 Tax=Drosophila miranda TaxID=7229 RepID=UPI0007E793C6|nr:uncharacterized protein LOC108156590 [Drosophila miranda]